VCTFMPERNMLRAAVLFLLLAAPPLLPRRPPRTCPTPL